MRLRRFVGADAAAATRLVRERLGPDAVILATRAHPDGGIEITAAVDADLAAPAPARGTPPPPVLLTDAVETAAPAVAAPLRGAADGLTDAATLSAIAHELYALRAHVAAIDRTLAPLRDAEQGLGGEGRAIARLLVLGGLAPPLAEAVAARFETARAGGADARAALAASVGAELLAAPPPPAARVTALVGPTGAGKTTTIAKLAAARRRAGEERVGLVMADTYRIGAGEQLGTYARLLGLPMRIARDGGELRDALREFADCDRVYVDTTGLSADAAVASDVTALLAAAAEPFAVTAVVSAGDRRRRAPAGVVAPRRARAGELRPHQGRRGRERRGLRLARRAPAADRVDRHRPARPGGPRGGERRRPRRLPRAPPSGRRNAMTTQAEGLRDGARAGGAASPRIRAIAVASGKGGVGKTNVVANLAVALSRRGQRVIVVDADLGLANLDTLLGLHPRLTLRHVLHGECGIKDALVEGPAGIRIVPAATRLRRADAAHPRRSGCCCSTRSTASTAPSTSSSSTPAPGSRRTCSSSRPPRTRPWSSPRRIRRRSPTPTRSSRCSRPATPSRSSTSW